MIERIIIRRHAGDVITKTAANGLGLLHDIIAVIKRNRRLIVKFMRHAKILTEPFSMNLIG
jgi:hypothetical protein